MLSLKAGGAERRSNNTFLRVGSPAAAFASIWITQFRQHFSRENYLENYFDQIPDTTFTNWGDYIAAPSAHPDSTLRHAYPDSGVGFNVWSNYLGHHRLDNGALEVKYLENYHYGLPMSYYLEGAKYLHNNGVRFCVYQCVSSAWNRTG